MSKLNASTLLDENQTKFVQIIDHLGGRSYIVGGTIRDLLLGSTPKDIDLEITGVSQSELELIIPRFGFEVRFAGHRPGVFLVSPAPFSHSTMFEVALPQRRVRHSAERSDYTVTIDHTMSIDKSLQRRDLTCNAIALDCITNEIHDPTNGIEDIRNGLLRAVNPDNFGADPLRVLRVMRFASTKDMEPTVETVQSAFVHIDGFASLSLDRVRSEWLKWAAGVSPARGLRFLVNSGWSVHFPTIHNMIDLPQDETHHPEGCVMRHTILALDAVQSTDVAVVFATLLHDIGKDITTNVDPNGRITSPGHAEVGADMVTEFFASIGGDGQSGKLVAAVQALVADHMWLLSFQATPTKTAVRRLASRLAPATVRQWAQVVLADVGGRGLDVDWHMVNSVLDVVNIADSVQVLDSQPAPLVMGRHLIEMGVRPGVEMGRILDAAFQAQMNGEFSDLNGGIQWVADQIG